jgi:anthranilate phosphoribosyltransferase
VLNELGSNKVMVVHGFDGLDEITLSQNTYICELKNKKITNYNFDPRDIGYEYISLDDIKGGDPKYNAECFMKMINGDYNQFQKIVEINAGAAIYLSGKAINIKEGALIAEKSIAEGRTKEFISRITNE